MKLSVIIINYNSLDYLLVCLDSVLKASAFVEGGTEIIVVDNNSDCSPQNILKETYPDVLFLQNYSNKGFSQANNQAIRKAQGEYILLLNPDTVLPEDCLVQVCDFLDAHNDAGALGIRGISCNGTVFPEHRRNAPTLSNMLLKYTKLCDKQWVRNNTKTFYDYSDVDNGFLEVEVTSGSCLFLNRRLLGNLSYLPEDYFMYFEDTDLCMQISKAGYKIYYLPVSFLHFKSVSSNRYGPEFVKNFFNSMKIYFKKYSVSKTSYALAGFMCEAGKLALSIYYAIPRKSRLAEDKVTQQFSTSDHSYKEIINLIESDKGEHLNEIYNPDLNVVVRARYNF